MVEFRWQVVEIRKEGGEEYLTLQCGHVVDRWHSFPYIGKFEQCEHCMARANKSPNFLQD